MARPTLDEILADNDDLGLLDVKLSSSTATTEEDRIRQQLEEINSFIDKHGRIPGDTGICQTSCPLISCGVSDFRGAVFVFGVEPDWSSRLPVSGFA